ncbi:hypothetical protein J2Z84_004037 [Agrobacterium rubi]|uniref:Uncharacterized protein n=1 Tax=Agrobacterium tumefaciens TaxID=358 RepID=A0A5B9T114_AGRTU|nr:hypothetical protein [Agrobacterium rubi]QEG97587.1 hypothetical protein AgrTiKerr108_00064 [Agrobacterium tumefaciens]
MTANGLSILVRSIRETPFSSALISWTPNATSWQPGGRRDRE